MPPGTVWTQSEDELLKELVERLGEKKWALISQQIGSKTSKQCRRRWMNHLNLETKKCGWSTEEDALLLEMHKEHGNKWTVIAKSIGGRTDNAVKNRYYVLTRRDEKCSTSRTGSLSSSSEMDEEQYQWNGELLNGNVNNNYQHLFQSSSLDSFRERQNIGQRDDHGAKRTFADLDNVDMMRSNSKKPDLKIIVPEDGIQQSAMEVPREMVQIWVKQDVLSPVEKRLALEVNEMKRVPWHINFVGSGRDPDILKAGGGQSCCGLGVNGEPALGNDRPFVPFPSSDFSPGGPSLDFLLDSLTAMTPKSTSKSNAGPGKIDGDGFVGGEPFDDFEQGPLNEDHIKLLAKLFSEAKRSGEENFSPSGALITERQQDPSCTTNANDDQAVRLPSANLASPFSSHVPIGLMSPCTVQLSPKFSEVELEALLSALSPMTPLPTTDLVEFMQATSHAGGDKLLQHCLDGDGRQNFLTS